MASKLISRRMISVCATDPRQPLTFYSNASSTKKKGKVFSPIFQSTFHVFTHFLKAKSLTLFFLGLIYPMLSLINEIFRDFPIKDFGDPPPSKSDKTHYWTFTANLCGRHQLFCVRASLGKPQIKKCRVYLGIAQIAIALPPFTQTGTLGHFIPGPT